MRPVRFFAAFDPSHCWKRALLFPAALLIALSAGCGSDTSESPTLNLSTAPNEPDAPPVRPERPKFNPYPEVEVKTSAGIFTLKLNAQKAPLTVNNFLYYVNRGLYNGTLFHEVYRDFIMLGGGFDEKLDPTTTQMPIRNEAHNGLKNTRGTIAMARSPDNIDSATNQFFINLADNLSLDYASEEPSEYGYCVFGEVTSGMDVVDRLGQAKVQPTEKFQNAPVEPIIIESMRQLK